MLSAAKHPPTSRTGRLPQRVLLATTNPAKQERLRWLLDGTGVQCVSPADVPGLRDGPPIPENWHTHMAIARGKAREWSRRSGMAALASDGGLVIPALGQGWESLLTGRFAGAAATNRERLDRLLALMQPFTGEQRVAWWVEAAALADGGRVLGAWQAESARGYLAEGYDPATIKPGFWAFSLWRLPPFGKCHAELTPAEAALADDHWARLRALLREALTRGAQSRTKRTTPP